MVRIWSEEELLAKSDFVVIATPTAGDETAEHTKREWWPLIGVETEFAVSEVLKGNQNIKTLVLHHYRYADSKGGGVNSPLFVSFDPAKKQTFRRYLGREADGRYAPVAGQLDGFEMSVREIRK